jgi:hypothetical protein
MLEAIILAVLACVVAFLFMGRGNGKPIAALSAEVRDSPVCDIRGPQGSAKVQHDSRTRR